METNQFYPEVYDINNLFLAYKKARKGKSKKLYVVEFEKDLIKNLVMLSEELKSRSYFPLPLKTFILSISQTPLKSLLRNFFPTITFSFPTPNLCSSK